MSAEKKKLPQHSIFNISFAGFGAGGKQLTSHGPPPSLTKYSVVAAELHSIFLHNAKGL